jgi:hypothetical protein
VSFITYGYIGSGQHLRSYDAEAFMARPAWPAGERRVHDHVPDLISVPPARGVSELFPDVTFRGGPINSVQAIRGVVRITNAFSW